jgi:hypothetical protein
MSGVRRWPHAALACLALAGCAAGSGVVPVGPDTYVLSEMRAPVLGGGPEAQRAVLGMAAGFCQQQGRAFRLLALVPDGDPRTPYWPTAFDATFQCLAEARPAPEPAQAR